MKIFLTILCCLIAQYQLFAQTINWEQFMAKQNMKWEQLGKDYYSGITLGNGLMGLNIYQAGDSTIRLDVGRSDVIDVRAQLMPEAGKLYTKARLPIGHFMVNVRGKILRADIQLHLYDAIATGKIFTDQGTVDIAAYVDAKHEVIHIELKDQQNRKLDWKWEQERSVSFRYMQSHPTDKPKTYPDNPPVVRKNINEFVVYHQPLLNHGGYSTVFKASKDEMLVSVGYDATASADEDLEAINSIKGFEKDINHLKNHKSWWHQYYQKSFVSLPDKRMENFYWIQLYKLASITRENKILIDLMGPWASSTPWPAIWWNLNTQLTYSPVFAANHLELTKPLFQSFKTNLQNLINNAPEKWRYNSAFIGRSSSYDLISPTNEADMVKGPFEAGNLTWMMYYYYKYYEYAGDKQLLKTEIYPLLKRSVNFLLHILYKDEQGVYHLPLSHSPEYKNAVDANYSLASLNWGLNTLISINTSQGFKDGDEAKWREVIKNLTAYPKGEDGFLIGRDVALTSSHRHYSHLLMIYPYGLVNWDHENERALILKSVNHWISMKGALQGYTYTGSASMFAQMENGDKSYALLNELFNKYIQPNTLYKESGPVIETPLAAATSIQELLLQNWNDKIRIFPAIPESWKDVSFKDLRTDGAFLISANRRNGKTNSIQINSLIGGGCIISSDITNFTVTSNKRKSLQFEQKKVGAKVEIRFSGLLANEIISVNAMDNSVKNLSVSYSHHADWYWGYNSSTIK
ncbi:glycosyl hydrolase family 95 catalytic domain-containing protein [Pedobacter frigidisoli]|uniref:glycosyl hydrolase family 95 catalytic domain-containing protein n=1 Tax=Pedobacter frigidisoli TaxID=2530455 RepID=UPI0029304937|nr:hypothetical protein [Pedobacter frigidisoli]